jgi:hypothetical protein
MSSDKEILSKSVKVVGKSFNASVFKDLMESFEDKVIEFEEASKALKVQGAPSEQKSIELGGLVKKLDKALNKARLDAKRPYLDFGNELDGYVRPVQLRLQAIEKSEKSKCKKYRNKLLQEQREAEALKREQEEKARLAAAKKKGALAALKTEKEVVVKEAAKRVDTYTSSSAGYKTVHVPYLVDITKVDKKYLQVDWKLVKADVKAGILKIDGFEIKEEIDMTLRG